MKLSDNWFTTVTESDNGAVMFVSGRDEIDAFMESGKLRERVEITWPYESDAQGMPTEEESMRMEAPQEALRKAMEKDKLAILTGIYTGDGARTWVFYTRNIPAFGERLNQALAPFEQLPITIYTGKRCRVERIPRDAYALRRRLSRPSFRRRRGVATGFIAATVCCCRQAAADGTMAVGCLWCGSRGLLSVDRAGQYVGRLFSLSWYRREVERRK